VAIPPAGEQRIVQADGRAKVYRPLPVVDRAQAMRAGFRHYDAGEPFEAHEAWEPAWMGTDDLAERALIQGLIKVAAADVHGRRGNPAGVVRNLEGALERLRYARASGVMVAPGATIDLDALIALAETRLALAGTGVPGPTIAIPWRPGP
jgi:predicted metal-dependent hydrolase